MDHSRDRGVLLEDVSNEKYRAGRNQTLTLTPTEELTLSKRLVSSATDGLSFESILNRTILGDSLKIVEHIPKGIADLIILDPPYNLNKDFHGLKFKATDERGYLEYLRSWFPKVLSILKDSGSVYLCGDWRSSAALQQVMTESMTLLNRITWQREKGRGALHNWKNSMEDIWYGVKNPKNYYFDAEAVKMRRKVIAPYKENGKPKDWEETEEGNFRNTYASNFWDDISVPYWSMPENTDHPTQKPEKLIAKLILSSCPEGGLVFDPFLGSGTTSVVAKKLGRNYLGVEVNLDYALWAEKRLANADADKSIQGYVDGVFWERNSLAAQKKSVKTKTRNTSPSIFD